MITFDQLRYTDYVADDETWVVIYVAGRVKVSFLEQDASSAIHCFLRTMRS
jgi:hypothetical protein